MHGAVSLSLKVVLGKGRPEDLRQEFGRGSPGREALPGHRQSILLAIPVHGFGLRLADYQFQKVLKHTAAPDAPAPGPTSCPKLPGSCVSPNSGRGCTSSSGLLARDDIACAKQATMDWCNAQHDASKLVDLAAFVKLSAGGVAECPVPGRSPGSRQASLVNTMWMASASVADRRRAATSRSRSRARDDSGPAKGPNASDGPEGPML
jgi:hypothetical protein